ncbi:MAG: hypothetical protein ABI451_07975 [Dokdonella sp.]
MANRFLSDALQSLRTRFAKRAIPLVIVVRQSPDWAHEDRAMLLENSRAFCRMIGRPEEFVADSIQLWDATCTLPYFAVRAEIKEIAEDNLRHVRSARIMQLADLRRDTIDPDALYLFIDDDDWLHPDFASRIAAHLTPQFVAWRYGSIKVEQNVELRAFDPITYTNNYAIRGIFLCANENDFITAQQHWIAEQLWQRDDFLDKPLPLYISATNKHPCSTMVLEQCFRDGISQATLRRTLAGYVDGLASAIPAAAEWTTPWVEKTRTFYRSLLS